jgi:hypothetical protein
MEEQPSIEVGPLKVWVTKRPFPHAGDYWESNWLSVTACCGGAGSRVEVTGQFLHLGELKKWKQDLERFHSTLNGHVELGTVEPTLKVKIEAAGAKTGHLDCVVSLTGDHLAETHRFSFEIDQSYLPPVIGQLAAVLREYPIQDEEKR